MKSRNICPKCNATDVIRIAPFKAVSTTSRVQLTKWGTQFALYDQYICLSCGFMEHYVHIDDPAFQKWLDKHLKDNSLDSDYV